VCACVDVCMWMCVYVSVCVYVYVRVQSFSVVSVCAQRLGS